MSLEKKVGLEVEFFLLNKSGKVIVPPAHWDRDGFPLLGEIRGKEGENVADVVTNFLKSKLLHEAKVRSGQKIIFSDIERISLATYREAMRQVTEPKGESIGKVKSLYGIDLDEFSDQIVSKGKIQGINASCGLHIHFSCRHVDKRKLTIPEYELVSLPLGLTVMDDVKAEDLAEAIIKPEIRLYKRVSEESSMEMEASSSQLNKPTIEWIVKQMDDQFFERFAPAKDKRTKYRHPGFYELKPYGFEYRSLPANDQTLSSIVEITEFAFELLGSLNKFD